MSTLLQPAFGELTAYPVMHRGQRFDLIMDLRSDTFASFTLQRDGRNGAAGWLYVQDGTDWHVSSLHVDPELRRQGLATALWEQAQEVFPGLLHDEIERMSQDGLAFAAAVGGGHLSLTD